MYNNPYPSMPDFGPGPESFEIKGKWTNRVTGQTVMVKDSVITDDDMAVILSDGSMIDMNTFSRDYIQMSDDIYDLNGKVIGHDHHDNRPHPGHHPIHEEHSMPQLYNHDFMHDCPNPHPGHLAPDLCPPKPLPEGVHSITDAHHHKGFHHTTEGIRPIHKPGVPKPPHHGPTPPKPNVRPPKPCVPPRPIPGVNPPKPSDGLHKPNPDFKLIKQLFDKTKPEMKVETTIVSDNFPVEELKMLNKIFGISIESIAEFLYETLVGRKAVLKALESYITQSLYPEEPKEEEPETPENPAPENPAPENPKCPCCNDGSIEISGPNGWTGEGPCPCHKPVQKPEESENPEEPENPEENEPVKIEDLEGNFHEFWMGDDNLIHYQDGDKEIFIMDDDGKKVYGWRDELERMHIKYLDNNGMIVHEILSSDVNLPNVRIVTSWDGNEYESTPDDEGNFIYYDDNDRQCMMRIEDGEMVYFYWDDAGLVVQVKYDESTGIWEETVLPIA